MTVPTLRFPEFRDAGEWEEKQLGKQVTLEYGAALPESQRKGGEFPVVGSNGVIGYHNSYLIEGPAIVVGRKGSVGQVNWIQSNCYPIDTTYYVRNNYPNSASLGFIKLILENCRLTELKDPSAVPGLNRDRVHSAKTVFPLPDEQQKIADCLSSIDELITAQAQKVEALKSYKKGLMQQLFPAEGETVPKLRFPEFRDAGEWEIKPLDKLFTIGNGRNYKHLSSGDIPVYGSGGYMLSVNDFLYDGESTCIGRKGTINNPMFLTGKFWTVDTLFYTHSFKDCLPKFIYLIFQNINWLSHNEAGGVPSLSKANIGKIEVAVPKPDEQQKIADCLFSLDELITAHTKKLATLKAHKKGLMQQLFPAINEVAG